MPKKLNKDEWREYRKRNRDRIRARQRRWDSEKWHNDPIYRAKKRTQQNERRAKNKTARNEYERHNKAKNIENYRATRRLYNNRRYKTSITWRLTVRFRNRLNAALRGQIKRTPVLNLIGCTIEELIIHIEKQFTNGMTWANYGTWHIDHIIPLASINVEADMNGWEKLWHHSNLQPLWASANLSKGDR